MKEEIKEMSEIELFLLDLTCATEPTLTEKGKDFLLDYITNLQKENEHLKKGINKILFLNNRMIRCESEKVKDEYIMKQWEVIYETLGIPTPSLARCSKNILRGDKE